MTNRLSAPAADPAAAVAAAAVWWRECHRLHATAPCPAAAPDRHGQQAGVLRAQECGWQNQPRAAALRRARLLCTRPRERSAGAVSGSRWSIFTPSKSNVECLAKVVVLPPTSSMSSAWSPPASQKLREYNRNRPATSTLHHQRPREGGADWRMARPSTAKARGSARVGLSACVTRQLLLLARRSRVAMPP